MSKNLKNSAAYNSFLFSSVVLTGFYLFMSGCSSQIYYPQQTREREKVRVFDASKETVWTAANQVLNNKMGEIKLADKEGGILRLELSDRSNITLLIEPYEKNKTKVYLKRSRFSPTKINETALLDEIGQAVNGQPK